MIRRFQKGLILFFFIPFFLLGADKEKKTYELIYKDIQLLKQEILELNQKTGRNLEDIQTIKNQVAELLALAQFLQSEQASLKEEQKKAPIQYQVLLERLETMNLQLTQFLESLIAAQQASSLPGEQEIQKEEPASSLKTPSEKPGEKKEREETPESIAPGLSPQEIYNMARTDYLKGNFELAVEGFQLYLENFPESPLSDDALFWIGECFFSQKKFEDAIEKFNDLILNYPHGDKVPASYLKKGFSLAELGKTDEALSVLKLLISKYPLEEETKIAQQKIKEWTNERYQQP